MRGLVTSDATIASSMRRERCFIREFERHRGIVAVEDAGCCSPRKQSSHLRKHLGRIIEMAKEGVGNHRVK
jgi:hypothetical protein